MSHRMAAILTKIIMREVSALLFGIELLNYELNLEGFESKLSIKNLCDKTEKLIDSKELRL